MNFKRKEEKNISNKKLQENSKKRLYNTTTNSINFNNNKKLNNNITNRLTNLLNENDNKDNYDSNYIGKNYKILQLNNKSSNSQDSKNLCKYEKFSLIKNEKLFTSNTKINFNKEKKQNDKNKIFIENHIKKLTSTFNNNNIFSNNFQNLNLTKESKNCDNKNNYNIFNTQINFENSLKNLQKEKDISINFTKKDTESIKEKQKEKEKEEKYKIINKNFFNIDDNEKKNIYFKRFNSFLTKNSNENKEKKINQNPKFLNNLYTNSINFNSEENTVSNNENNYENSTSIQKDENNSLSNSLKEEFSFLINSKEDRYDIFNLKEIISNVNSNKNKINSEYNDIKNLAKLTNVNDTKKKFKVQKFDIEKIDKGKKNQKTSKSIRTLKDDEIANVNANVNSNFNNKEKNKEIFFKNYEASKFLDIINIEENNFLSTSLTNDENNNYLNDLKINKNSLGLGVNINCANKKKHKRSFSDFTFDNNNKIINKEKQSNFSSNGFNNFTNDNYYKLNKKKAEDIIESPTSNFYILKNKMMKTNNNSNNNNFLIEKKKEENKLVNDLVFLPSDLKNSWSDKDNLNNFKQIPFNKEKKKADLIEKYENINTNLNANLEKMDTIRFKNIFEREVNLSSFNFINKNNNNNNIEKFAKKKSTTIKDSFVKVNSINKNNNNNNLIFIKNFLDEKINKKNSGKIYTPNYINNNGNGNSNSKSNSNSHRINSNNKKNKMKINYKIYKEKEAELNAKKDSIENKQKTLNEDLFKKLYKSTNNLTENKLN